MPRIAGLSVAAILLALAVPANAETVEGTIQSYDTSTRMVTLDNGAAYRLLETVDAAALEPGIRVTLNVEPMSGELVIDQVKAE
jgi:hypothetical protein